MIVSPCCKIGNEIGLMKEEKGRCVVRLSGSFHVLLSTSIRHSLIHARQPALFSSNSREGQLLFASPPEKFHSFWTKGISSTLGLEHPWAGQHRYISRDCNSSAARAIKASNRTRKRWPTGDRGSTRTFGATDGPICSNHEQVNWSISRCQEHPLLDAQPCDSSTFSPPGKQPCGQDIHHIQTPRATWHLSLV